MADDALIPFEVDGKAYFVNVATMTPRLDLRLWNEAGVTLSEAVIALQTGRATPGFFAVLAFIARVQAGDKVTFDEVAAGINYDSDCRYGSTAEPPPESQGDDSVAISPN